MDDLVVWLQAQLIADARRVTALHDLECEIHTHLDAGLLAAVAASRMLEDVPGAVCDCGVPARVLREIDVKRRLLAIHRPYVPEPDQACLGCAGGIMFTSCPVVRLLALPYADRPGYREEWAP